MELLIKCAINCTKFAVQIMKTSPLPPNTVPMYDRQHSFHPNALISFFLAVEYSEESMEDANNRLQAISSFIRDANAYIKGQLVCDPVREDILWER